jgi:hypothetical protein
LKKIIVSLSALLIVSVGGYLGYSAITENIEQKETIHFSQPNVLPNKEWVVDFDKGINKEIVNGQSIYVQDENNNKIPISLKVQDSKTLIIQPPKGGYEKGKTYNLFLNRDLDLEHIGNKKLAENYHIKFSVKKDSSKLDINI